MEIKPINFAWVVDDDPLQALFLNRLLTSHPAVLKTKIFSGARSAIEAIVDPKITTHELPDVIFLDLVMAKGDGWEFLDFYKKSRNKIARGCRIVVISSASDDNMKRLKQYSEVSGFLSKPIDKKELEDMIANIAKQV